MSKIKVLDCTLRDGGYVNQWKFGNDKIKSVLKGLKDSNIDIVECGYLSKNGNGNSLDETLFESLDHIDRTLCIDSNELNIVAMINHGEYDLNELLSNQKSILTGIRYAFHKKDMQEVIKACGLIKKQGYQLYLQPMVSLAYTDEEFLQLIKLANELEPYAFYIVDSFGTMKPKDLRRMLSLADYNLNRDIVLGFHSHNNLQLAYSNAQIVAELQTNREKIIDASIFGMGRGAGNLNTELFVEYLNDNYGAEYNIGPLLQVMDHTLNYIYQEKYWGYSLAHYVSAVHCCHPNYATYLTEKNALLMTDVQKIISEICEDKRYTFDLAYIEKLYFEYMAQKNVNRADYDLLKDKFCGKTFLVIAPGKSATDEKELIQKIAAGENVVTISINHAYGFVKMLDYIFVSNIRRFEGIEHEYYSKTIATSNIECESIYAKVDYHMLLNDVEAVEDNAGLMLLNLLIHLGAAKIYVAGMDGYTIDNDSNYSDASLRLIADKERIEKMNYGMTKVIAEYSKRTDIEFITKTKYGK